MGQSKERSWRCFEDEVFDAVKKALRVDYYFPEFEGRIDVRRNAEYSGASGNTYKLEVSVEMFRRNAQEPYLIWLWECKHKGSRKVAASEVCELSEKLSEIGKSRCKGSIVTTVGYQKGAINLANIHGITLCILKKDLEYVSRFAKNESTTARPVIYVEHGNDFDGHAVSDMRFPEYVRHCIREL